MRKVIKNLKNPRFKSKGLYLLFLPIAFLGWERKRLIGAFAIKHWNKNPAVMHRLKWAATI